MTPIGLGHADTTLSLDAIQQITRQAADQLGLDEGPQKRVLVIIPDATRSCPLPAVARALHESIAPRAAGLDFLIALGTHPAMDDVAIDTLLGVEPGQRETVFPGTNVFNHEWQNPDALTTLATFSRDEIAEYLDDENERFAREIDVTINSRIFDYDVVMICGPVFPHEVVGFSGGAKYFFPGICGEELLNFFHWLGALTTIPKMIGIKDTPVRALLHAAARTVAEKVQTCALCMVTQGKHALHGLYFGSVEDAWSAAADLASETHIVYKDKPFSAVLSCAPEMYDELWVGAKCMYKLECVVADGGELIIYAPHIHDIAVAHQAVIEQVGYHCLPYFTEQWDRFKDFPWGILAHSTHVRGIGTFDPATGIEQPRVRVTLATGIPEETCKKINMGYRDPATINPNDWANQEDEGKLLVPHAGEMLYRLNPNIAPEWQQCSP